MNAAAMRRVSGAVMSRLIRYGLRKHRMSMHVARTVFQDHNAWIDGGCEEDPVVIAWCDPCHEKHKLGDDVGMVITFRDGVNGFTEMGEKN